MIRVAELRKAVGISQFQLAVKVGVTSSAVAAWETGRNTPHTDMLPKLAEVFGCTIDELYDKKEGNDEP